MKKLLLLLLLLPFVGLAQLSGPTSTDVADGEGAAGLVFLGTTANANESLSNVQVNDTIILGLKLTNWLSSTNDITYAHIDLQYNKNAYTYIDETYYANTTNSNWSGGAGQNSTYEQNGYKFSANSAYEAYNLWDQWQNGSYGTNTDWNVLHFQTQVSYGDLADLDAYVTWQFKVHDAGANHDYTDNVYITMGKIVDNPNSKTYDPVYAYENQDLSYTPDADIDVAGITAKLVVGSNVDVTDFNLVPLVWDATNEYWTSIITGNTFWLNVPSNGSVDITEYITSTTDDYAVVWEYGEPGNPNGTNAFKTFYEDVLTVSDVQLALKELVQHDAGAINAGISKFNADVAGGTYGGDGQLTDADTYALLAHVMGVEELYIDWDNDGDIDDTDANNQGNYFFRSTDGTTYTTTTAASYEQNGITHQGGLVELGIDFSDTTNDQLFEVYGTWKGDVNLSHSPAVNTAIVNSAKSLNGPTLTGTTLNMSKAAATVNGTMIIEEQGDKVVAKITIAESNLTAAQIRLTFDDTRLTFDSVQTDTGNTTTNFAKLVDNRVNFGSINMLDETLDASTYTVTFSKKGIVNGVTGLITLTNTDAADTNADRVNLNIQ